MLLIGSDKRAKSAVDASTPAHSDTMLLVRLDPNEPETTMLSIPRDLKVTIHPDHGQSMVAKINAAYTLGGVKLTIKTIRQVLGVQINHVVDVNFAGFKALVNYLGCVYVQVDRRYYHSNVGLAAGQTYDAINIQPGYQKLCGDDALHYVRYRHADTDLIRGARQQDFLRQIKDQVGSSGLVARLHPIERLFGKYASTDIRSSDDVLKLLELLVQSASHPVRQIQFQATSARRTSPRRRRRSTRPSTRSSTAARRPTSSTPQADRPRRRRRLARGNVPLSPATSNEISEEHGLAATVPFKVYYPDEARDDGRGSAGRNSLLQAQRPSGVRRRRCPGRPRPVLRPRGHHLAERADPPKSRPDGPGRRAHDAALLRGPAAAHGRVA